MQKDDLIAVFRQMVPLSEQDELFIRERFSFLEVPAKRFLLEPNVICQQVFFVQKGCARIIITDKSGEETSCYFATEGEFIANYESFLGGVPSPYAIQTLEDCKLLVIDRKGMSELFEKTQYGERIGRIIAEFIFTDTLERLTSFYTETAEQRFERFQIRYPGLLSRIPQHYIATYVGVRPQSLSRIKKRSQKLKALTSVNEIG
jgi:CRP-like cAMP-binding protein